MRDAAFDLPIFNHVSYRDFAVLRSLSTSNICRTLRSLWGLYRLALSKLGKLLLAADLALFIAAYVLCFLTRCN